MGSADSKRDARAWAVGVAILSGILILGLEFVVGRRGPVGPSIVFQLKEQLGTVGGVLGALLVTTKPRDSLMVFRLSILALPIGVILSWMDRLLDQYNPLYDLAGVVHAYVAPALFSFAATMLVKSTDRLLHSRQTGKESAPGPT